MENNQILEVLKEIIFLLELKEENPFVLKAYRRVLQLLEAEDRKIKDIIKSGEVYNISGIGKKIGNLLEEIVATRGRPRLLLDLKQEIPREVRRFRRISGLGPAKIKLLWKDYGIDSWGKLKKFIDSGKILEVKGFGEKSVSKLKESLSFLEDEGDLHLLTAGKRLLEKLEEAFKDRNLLYQVAGRWRRGSNLLDKMDFIFLKDGKNRVKEVSESLSFQLLEEKNNFFKFLSKEEQMELHFYFVDKKEFVWELHRLTGNSEYLNAFIDYMKERKKLKDDFYNLEAEEEIYKILDLPYIYPELRESEEDFYLYKDGVPELLDEQDVKGIFHIHTTYSDGRLSLEEVINLALSRGYIYIAISDHSQSSYYAGGLTLEKLSQQKKKILELRQKYPQIRIFWGIESDILGDGSLDYPDKILSEFDFVIGSIHSSLSQSGEELTRRILKAIENPYFTFLGHPTGRLLTMRKGGDIDHLKILDALSKYGKGVELNCNPYRLDIDWKWLKEVKSRGIPLYLSPDAHRQRDFDYVEFGVKLARKGGLTPKEVVNCWSVEEVENLWSRMRREK